MGKKEKTNNCKIIFGNGTAGNSALVIEARGIAYRIDKYVLYLYPDDSETNKPILLTNKTKSSFTIYTTPNYELVAIRYNLEGIHIDPTTNKYIGTEFSGSCFLVYHLPSFGDEYRMAIFQGSEIKFASMLIKCKGFSARGIDIFPILIRFLEDIVQNITRQKYTLDDTKLILEQMQEQEKEEDE